MWWYWAAASQGALLHCTWRSAAIESPCSRPVPSVTEPPGAAADGRSGGQTIFGLATSQRALAAAVGRDDARRLFDMSIDALDLTQSLIRSTPSTVTTAQATFMSRSNLGISKN